MATKNISSPVNPTEWTSLHEPFNYINPRRNILASLGLFQSEFLNTRTLELPRVTMNEFRMVDSTWGTRVFNTQGDNKQNLLLKIPHFGVEDAITPLDIDQKIAWEDFYDPQSLVKETVERVQLRKMNQARRNVTRMWDEAMLHLVRDGSAYAPNGTVVTNYYTEFGVTRQDVPLAVSDPLVDPKTSIQAMIDTIIDNFKGGYEPGSFIGLLGRELFDELVSHPAVIDAARYGALIGNQNAEVLARRLGTTPLNLNSSYQVLDFGGVLWVRVHGNEMPADEGRIFPTDVDSLFKIFFAPSIDDFDVINTTALEAYYRIKMNEDRDRLRIRYESNPLVATLWPSAILRIIRS